jgi:hypothetical protein
LGRIDDDTDENLAGGGHFGRAAADDATFGSKVLGDFVAEVENMNLVSCTAQRLGHTQAHGSQPYQSNFSFIHN